MSNDIIHQAVPESELESLIGKRVRFYAASKIGPDYVGTGTIENIAPSLTHNWAYRIKPDSTVPTHVYATFNLPNLQHIYIPNGYIDMLEA